MDFYFLAFKGYNATDRGALLQGNNESCRNNTTNVTKHTVYQNYFLTNCMVRDRFNRILIFGMGNGLIRYHFITKI
jgi:hypothetical protein